VSWCLLTRVQLRVCTLMCVPVLQTWPRASSSPSVHTTRTERSPAFRPAASSCTEAEEEVLGRKRSANTSNHRPQGLTCFRRDASTSYAKVSPRSPVSAAMAAEKRCG
jgi:hypothetical protein